MFEESNNEVSTIRRCAQLLAEVNASGFCRGCGIRIEALDAGDQCMKPRKLAAGDSLCAAVLRLKEPK